MPNYNRTKFACFSAYLTMASAFCLPPILFTTFHEMYGISYTLLGTLVLINFCTQLCIDLLFTFFSRYFNIKWTIRLMPVLTSVGMALYALSPLLFRENPFIGLALATVIYSVSAGLSEVLISPIVAACPSDNPEKDMSFLHGLYGWGVVFVVLSSSLILRLVGNENWTYLVLFFAVLPLITAAWFCLSPLPPMDNASATAADARKAPGRAAGFALCAVCIFLGGCSESLMTNWISNYMEVALNVPKAVGDIAGMAVFALLLASARTLYSRFGKNIQKTLFLSMLLSAVCYLTAGLVQNVIFAFAACILTGFCSGMLWPGTLIMMEENIPAPGVAIYALMAAAGDLGGSLAPQMMGVVTDKVAASGFAARMCERLSLTPDAVGLKAGMVIGAVFPLCGIFVVMLCMRQFRKRGAVQKGQNEKATER